MNRIFLLDLSFALMSPMEVKSDDRIYETKNICGRYSSVEINDADASMLLGLKDSCRVSSRAELTLQFLSLSFLFMLSALAAHYKFRS